jgi:hypothetical protein
MDFLCLNIYNPAASDFHILSLSLNCVFLFINKVCNRCMCCLEIGWRGAYSKTRSGVRPPPRYCEIEEDLRQAEKTPKPLSLLHKGHVIPCECRLALCTITVPRLGLNLYFDVWRGERIFLGIKDLGGGTQQLYNYSKSPFARARGGGGIFM